MTALAQYTYDDERYGFCLPYLATILGPHDIVIPDLLFISAARRSIIRDYVWGAPDLLIEVTSDETRHRDYGVKHERYALLGVSEYWIVDTDAEFVDVFILEETRYSHVATVCGEDRIPSRVLPSFVLTAPEVFDDTKPYERHTSRDTASV